MIGETNLLPTDGEVYYYPAFFPSQDSSDFFVALRQEIEWKQEPIMMFGKSIMQPRLTAWYGDEGKSYRYSGITMRPKSWTATLKSIKEKIEGVAKTKFTSALLNQYRDGNDSVGWHRDNEKELGDNPVIGSVSFGAPRNFLFKHVANENLKIKLVLESGSFLLMKNSTQHHWLHCVPKTKSVLEPRINITFRTIL